MLKMEKRKFINNIYFVACLFLKKDTQEKIREYYRETGKYKIREKKEEKVKLYERREDNPQYKLRSGVSALISYHLKKKGSSKEGASFLMFVDWTIPELKEHLEKQFIDGMTWENKGRGGWHLDHIYPASKFIYSSMSDYEFSCCWSLENLRPMWETLNICKRDKVTPEGEALFIKWNLKEYRENR